MERQKINMHQVFWYVFIFSIIGLIIETLYCYFTTGVLESRKGLIWGPFCPIYGVGAAILIIVLDRYRNNVFKLFIYGIILGSLVEYVLSFGLEAIFGMRFWEYSYIDWHLNGRIAITYSFFWGVLALLVIKLMKPVIDKIIDKITFKWTYVVEIGLIVFLIIDVLATIWAVSAYEKRVVKNYYYPTPKQENTSSSIIRFKNGIEETYFSNEKMLKTFPNLRVILENGEEIYIRDLIKE